MNVCALFSGRELPLSDRIDRGLTQESGPRNDARVRYAPSLGDPGLHDYEWRAEFHLTSSEFVG